LHFSYIPLPLRITYPFSLSLHFTSITSNSVNHSFSNVLFFLHYFKIIWISQCRIYDGVSKSFRTGHLERELQMIYSSLPLGAVISLFCESV
jgi:hypothetical protein